MTARISQKQYDVLRSTLRVGKTKYKTNPGQLEGITFQSSSEIARYRELKRREEQGEISGLCCQKGYELAPGVKLSFRKRASPPLRYTADFVYVENGETVVEDVKPDNLPNEKLEKDFVMRCHLMKAVHGLDVRVWRRSGK